MQACFFVAVVRPSVLAGIPAGEVLGDFNIGLFSSISKLYASGESASVILHRLLRKYEPIAAHEKQLVDEYVAGHEHDLTDEERDHIEAGVYTLDTPDIDHLRALRASYITNPLFAEPVHAPPKPQRWRRRSVQSRLEL